jgi:hypothetical protein
VVSGFALAFVAPSAAHADSVVSRPEAFAGSAAATALDLSLNGQQITVGQGVSKVTSALLSAANGTAINSLLGSATSSASVSSTNGSIVDGPKCASVTNLVVLTINNACTTSTSTVVNGLAHAVTSNTVDAIPINLNTVLSALPLGQVSDTLTSTLQGVVNLLPAPLQTTLDPVKNTVGGVLNDVLHTPTASLTIGESGTSVESSATQVVSTGIAHGGELDILPAPAALNGALQPLVSVIVGSSSATASYDRLTGKATPSFDPALVTVKLGATPLTPAVTIPVKVGTTQTIQLPAGLGSITLQVADGDTFTRPDGTVGSEANAVKLAVTLLNQPVINLAIAGAQATVAGAPAVVAPAPAPTPAVAVPAAPVSLPRTGGTPWIPMAGGLGLAAFLITRRLMVAASH